MLPREAVVSLLGELQKLPGHEPGRPALGSTAGAAVGPNELLGSLPASAFL